MKKASILACALLFAAVAAFAQAPPSQPPLTQEALAAILGLPAAGSCAAQPSGVREVAKRPAIPTGKALCTATAKCQFTTISCSGNNSTTSCTAVDANCSAGVAGHVTCDGVTTSCPACCTGTGTQYWCCVCARRGDCYDCCRCDGGTVTQCLQGCP
jgi:hypothetical protein